MIVTAVAMPIAITAASIRRVRTAGRRNKVTCIRRKNAAFCCYKRYAGGADGASRPPLFSAGRGGRCIDRDDPGVRSNRGSGGLAGRIDRVRSRDRRGRRDPGRSLRGLPAVPEFLRVSPGILTTPRPVPNRVTPIAASAAVLVLALPIFLVAGWRLSAWALAAVLWLAGQGLGLLLVRLRIGLGNLAASGVLAFGRIFRGIGVMVVLV